MKTSRVFKLYRIEKKYLICIKRINKTVQDFKHQKRTVYSLLLRNK